MEFYAFRKCDYVEFYFIRHGQSEANKAKIIQGHLDSPLSDLGREQAQTLKKYLTLSFDMVVTSDLSRAVETAEIIFGDNIPEENKFLELREMHIGDLEGKLVSDYEIDPEHRRLWLELEEDHLSAEFKSEHISDFLLRTKTKFEELVAYAKSNQINRMCVVSHGGVMKAIVGNYLGITKKRFQNTEVVGIIYTNGKWLLKERIANSI